MDKLLLIPLAIVIILGALILSTYKGNTATGAATTGRLIDKAYIPSSHIQDMTYEHVQKIIADNKSALIFFYNNSCDECIAQIAEIEGMMDYFNANNPKIFDNFTYFEYDINTGLKDKFNVTGHHTLILIKGGKEVLRTDEPLTKDELLEKII
jgi:hypothetical protein